MIHSFKDERAEALLNRRPVKSLPPDIVNVARRKLIYLADAAAIGDLAAPPANRLEKLKGDRDGQWSIRINDQWRICFKWQAAVQTENDEDLEAGPYDVEIVDYH